MSLIVSEIFGPTAQGEGPAIGQPCGFIRLMACNLSCSWCDTPYTWDSQRFDLKLEGKPISAREAAEKVGSMGVDLCVISGGEPLLHQKRVEWAELLELLRYEYGISVHIETNGTIVPNETTISGVDLFVVSPKLSHAGDPPEKRIRLEALEAFVDIASSSEQRQVAWKFVAQKPQDLDEISVLAYSLGIPPHRVWVMPEGISSSELQANLEHIAAPVIERGWNLTTRLHVLAWGSRRGV